MGDTSPRTVKASVHNLIQSKQPMWEKEPTLSLALDVVQDSYVPAESIEAGQDASGN